MRRSIVLAAALAAVGLYAWACSTPTEPVPAGDAASGVRPSSVATKVDITVGSTTIVIDTSTVITVTVTREGTPDPAIVQVGISTTLGNFGLDSSGKEIQTVTCTSSNTTCPLVTADGVLTATVTLNAGSEEGSATIVATAGSVTGTAQVTVETPPPLFLEKLDPAFGPPAGGTEVRIFGQGLRTSTPRVNFGDALAEFVGLAQVQDQGALRTVLVVKTPPSAAEVPVGSTLAVDVEVSFPDDGSGISGTDSLTGAFTYAHGPGGGGDDRIAPVILSVDPPFGPNRGGIDVALNGSGFDPRGVVVMFGSGKTVDEFQGVEASQKGTPSATQVVVTLPSAPPDLRNQSVDILLRNTATGLFSLATAIFTYQAEDVILNLDPQELVYRKAPDESRRDREVTVTAMGLADERQTLGPLQVEFGGGVQGVCASVDSVNDNCRFGSQFETLVLVAKDVEVMDCEPPTGALTLTNTQTGEVSMGPTFSYTADVPSLQSLDPAKAGQTEDRGVTLLGTFSTLEADSTVVRIDGQNATVNRVRGEDIRVRLPSFTGTFDEEDCGESGKKFVEKQVDVKVTYTLTGCSAELMGGFTYTPDDTSCREPDAAPVANFAVGTPSGADMLTVEFTDTSSGSPTAWSWDFGDGTTFNGKTPDPHTFPQGGTFNVTLIVSNAVGSSSVTKAVTVGLDAAVADFEFTVNGLDVTFTNTSQNATDFAWDFGDGGSSTAESPTHTYQPGTYNVTLTASNASSSDSITKPVTVAVDPPVASFAFALDASDASMLTVDFTDTSTGTVDSRAWILGDGNTDTQASFSHTYAAAGTFDVTLTVTNAGGSSSVTQSVTVGVVAPVASFTFSKDTADSTGLTFIFVDTSTGNPTSVTWGFTNGTAVQTGSPVTHVFTTAGSYPVTLTVTNAGGSDSVTQVVDAAPDPPVAGFTFTISGMDVQFTNTSSGQVDSFIWFFGDGMSDSTTSSPMHTYAASGTFSVTLQVRNTGGTDSLVQQVVIP